MHGCGVSTPSAAAVAAATWGLDGLMHRPNGMMLSIGTWSWMVAFGCRATIVRLIGSTIRLDGDEPNVHIVCAPFTTCSGILLCLFQSGAETAVTPGVSRHL